MGGRVTICTTGPGASSPTKSMSSGSMSGIVQDPTLGREVVTVNVNQINEDLIRQVGAVSNTVNPPASHSYLQGNIFDRKSSKHDNHIFACIGLWNFIMLQVKLIMKTENVLILIVLF